MNDAQNSKGKSERRWLEFVVAIAGDCSQYRVAHVAALAFAYKRGRGRGHRGSSHL